MAVYQGSLTVKRRPKDGAPGTPGSSGPIPIQKEWVVGDTHRFNDEIKDFIYVRGTSQNDSYWYTRTSKGDVVADSPPVGGAKVEGYTKVDWLRTLAVNVLLAEEANLANFIFKDEKLISVRGTVDGVEANYSGQANFKPYIILDGKTGKIYAQDAEITGVINALSGELGSLIMKEGGYIDLPPSFTDEIGRLDNTGLSFIYDGANSQKIEWYSGLGTFAGQITCNSQGRLRLSSFFGIELAVDFLDYSPISITGSGFNHSVNFGSAEVGNIRKLFSIGQLNMAYTTHALSANTWYHISTDVTLIIITSAGSGSVGIYRITGSGNSTPSNGDIKIITNATNDKTVYLKTTKPSGATYNSNIKVPTTYDGSDFNLHENSSIMLVYYGGYWRVQTDRGQ